MNEIKDNTRQGRYELSEAGETAYADYALDGRVLRINYVFAPPALRGKGTAGRLMQGIADTARARNLKIQPLCGYAATWLRRHDGFDGRNGAGGP
jgi:predicted GNAT family acetyltransferase